MLSKSDKLLADYTATRSGPVFGKLVANSINHVHSVALRVTRNHGLAEDISQEVFLRLATKPEAVPSRMLLAVWLHRTTTSLAIDLIRSEEARRQRAARYAETQPSRSMDWSNLAPEIDAALEELPEADRSAIILRYYENSSLRQIANTLGIQEKSAHSRVQRALEKLRTILAKRGLATTSAFLATSLGAHATTTAPAHLAASVLSASQAAFGTAAVTSTAALSTLIMNIKAIAIPAACVSLLAVTAWQRSEINHRREIADSSQNARLDGNSTIPTKTSRIRSGTNSRSKAEQLVSTARRLAAIEPLAAREAALMDWAQRFKSSEEILNFAAVLRGTSDLPPDLRTRLASALTRQWAMIDPAGAMDAYAASALQVKSSPFGGIEQEVSSNNPGFDIIAATNPDGFIHWVKGNPGVIIDLLNWNDREWKPDSPVSQALMSSEKHNFSDSPETSWPYSVQITVFNSIARTAPAELMTMLQEAFRSGYRLRTDVMDPGIIASSLANKYGTEGGAWKYLTAEFQQALGDDYVTEMASKLAIEDTRPITDLLEMFDGMGAELSNLQRIGIIGERIKNRQAILSEADSAARDFYIEDFETFGQLLYAQGPAADPTIDRARQTMAIIAAREDKDAAIAWAEAITDPDSRVEAAAGVARALAGQFTGTDSSCGILSRFAASDSNTDPESQQNTLSKHSPVADLVRGIQDEIETETDFPQRGRNTGRYSTSSSPSLKNAMNNRNLPR